MKIEAYNKMVKNEFPHGEVRAAEIATDAVAALCYAVGGNMITYNLVKLALLSLKAKLGYLRPDLCL